MNPLEKPLNISLPALTSGHWQASHHGLLQRESTASRSNHRLSRIGSKHFPLHPPQPPLGQKSPPVHHLSLSRLSLTQRLVSANL